MYLKGFALIKTLISVVLQKPLTPYFCLFIVGEQATRMVVAVCRKEKSMVRVCKEIEDLRNQLAAEIASCLQQNAWAMPPVPEDDIMKQLAAQPEVLLCYCFLYMCIRVNVCKCKEILCDINFSFLVYMF